MSDSSKAQQRPGATPIKNPLLSASVTGLTFDDFPNKPLLLPAAPPIIHAPPIATIATTAPVTPSALLGREHKSLVTVGSSSVDTENLDEINLNSSNEESVTASAPSDANANPLLEQTPTTDSILSQAASSFSALPSVASNVLSSFSKRITSISSRETTPVHDQSTADGNANYPVQQLDIQPTYTQHQTPPLPEPFYAPPPPTLGPQGAVYFGVGFTPTSLGAEDLQRNVTPLEPPKFYTPGEVTTLPSTAALPPPSAGASQNNFRFAARKKLYAPIPGFSEQNQQPAATFDSTAISAPLAYDPLAIPFPNTNVNPAYQTEERKPTGGLFSKITNLAPAGVLQNITGLVQSAAGTITQTIKPEVATQTTSDAQQYPSTGISFEQQQQPSNYFASGQIQPPPAVNYFASSSEGQPAPLPSSVATNQQVPLAATLFNPQASGDLTLPAKPFPPPPAVQLFDPFKAPAKIDPTKPISNQQEADRPSSQLRGVLQDPFTPVQIAPPPSSTILQASGPPSHPSRAQSQPGIQGHFAHQQIQTDPIPTQTGFFAPPDPFAAPPAVSVAPPPAGGQTSFRLQKGTKLYKSPLNAEETAAATQILPQQIAAQPIFGNTFVSPPIVAEQSFAPPAFGAFASTPINQSVVAPPSTSNTTFLPFTEKQKYPVFDPFKPIGFATPLADSQPGEQSVALFAASTNEQSEPAIEVKKEAITTERDIFVESNQISVPETLHAKELGKEVSLPEVNPSHFFKPIEPVVESTPSQPQNTEASVNFFGAHQLFRPIESVLEDQPQDKIQTPQVIPTAYIEQSLQKLAISTEPSICPIESEVKTLSPPAVEIESQQESNQATDTAPISSESVSSLQATDLNTLPSSLPPPAAQASLGSSNPYRRDSTSESTKPSVGQPVLANFFTPGPSAGAGDFNFFATLPSSQDSSAQNFFTSNIVEQQGQQSSSAPESTLQPIPTINFFADPTVTEIEQDRGTSTSRESKNIIAAAPYPSDNSIQQVFGSTVLPPLPTNIGIIPTVQETTEDILKHQGEFELLCQAPPPPIGFEGFETNENQTLLPSAATTIVSAHSIEDGTEAQVAPNDFEIHYSNQQNIAQQPILITTTTTDIPQQQQEQQQKLLVNNFQNFFNQNLNAQFDSTRNSSSFFDSLAGPIDRNQLSGDQPASAQIPGNANEDQRIQNFFNNPPPQDAYHAGDLNYDLIHSGLGLRNLEQHCLTPISNLVEPPSSACSEFSNLTADISVNALETSAVAKEVTKVEDESPPSTYRSTVDSSKDHIGDLPEEVIEELRMANLLLSDKAANTGASSVSYEPVVKHWFYKRKVDNKVLWTPFSHYDSALLETSITMTGGDKESVVAVEGGRYDVNIGERLKRSVYWDSEPIEIRRCSWFYKALDAKYIPYEESTAETLEAEYRHAVESGVWPKTIVLTLGEQVVYHSPTVIVHNQQQQNQDAWGGTTQTTTRPRVVRRDLNDFRIEQGESQKVDHLLFMVHGIGSACDLKLRSVEEVVDDFRTIAHQLVQSHYKNSTDLGLVGRVEVLPISWHKHLHSLELGIDEKLRSITLESIPKLRNFTNDTLLDILFYTSPTFAQRIMNSIVMSLNDMYMKYRHRHPDFNGGVSLAGHSLGSLIMFDLLCHQNPVKELEEKNLVNPDDQFLSRAHNEGEEASSLDGEVPGDSNRMDSKQMGYTVGPAGTGQPFISYGQLVFQPKKFFALGSPIGMFVTIRGIDKLGLDFRLPTCPGFYNIFHPYDPVAYRIEALVNPDLSGCRPVLIPHHKGRKRMHLELKETMARVSTDLKNKILDKFKHTFESVNIFGHSTQSKKEAEELMEKEVEKVIEMQMQLESQDQPAPHAAAKTQQNQDSQSPSNVHLLSPTQTARKRTDSASTVVSDDMIELVFPLGKLNDSRRIDYVLQEAPLELINEYLFALSSHVCYWESEDTILFVIKEIYSGLGISPDSQVPQQTMTIERPSSRNSLSNS